VIAANRVGKTEGCGGYEMTCHLTGIYPDWWEGRRFDHAITGWAAGDTSKSVRDILQVKLLGKFGEVGTGLIPGDLIVGRPTAKAGVPDAIESAHVKHVTGHLSTLIFKSYEQGREAFQGTEIEVVWHDEEPPLAIYTESLMRTMPAGAFTGGLMMITFTPLQGWTEVVGQFLDPTTAAAANRYCETLTWDDAPHLTEADKAAFLASVPVYQRDARSKGKPQLGSGAIYPISEDDVAEDDFEIPKHWPRVWALDHGWDNFAALWGALDRESQTTHIYSGIKMSKQQPAIHADAIRARGEWIPGVGDAAAVNNADGEQVINTYRRFGLQIQLPDKAVEAGIWDVYQDLSAGRMRVFKSVRGFFDEYRLYRRDEKGNVVKRNDHYMDCLRYLRRSGLSIAICKPEAKKIVRPPNMSGQNSWMS